MKKQLFIKWQLMCRKTLKMTIVVSLKLSLCVARIAKFLNFWNGKWQHMCRVTLFFNFGRIQAKYHHQFLLSFLPFFLVCLKAHGNHRIAHKLKLHDTSPKLSTTLTLSCSAMYSSILKILVHGNICDGVSKSMLKKSRVNFDKIDLLRKSLLQVHPVYQCGN